MAAEVEHGPAAGEDEGRAGDACGEGCGVEGGKRVGGEAVGEPGCGEDCGEEAEGLHDEEGALGAFDGCAAAAALGAEEDGCGGGRGVVGGEGGGVGAEGLAELVVGDGVCGNPGPRIGTWGTGLGRRVSGRVGGHREPPAGARNCLALLRARKRRVRTLRRWRPVAEEISAWSMPST